jgi:glutamate dehydrogenase/leucine dehydrogenase
VLVPAALENQITNKNIAKVKTKVVLELANGPVTQEASKKLWKKGITVVPDILANGGGVTVSFFEWKQNLLREHWAKKFVLSKLETYMKRALSLVLDAQRRYHTDMREASYIVAVSRIANALKKKGMI